MKLWHILFVYIRCPCDLDLWPIYTKSGLCDQTRCWTYMYIMYIYTFAFLKYSTKKADFGWSIPVPLYQVWTWYTTYRYGDYNFPLTASLNSKFYVFGDKGGQISIFIFLTPKRHLPWPEQSVMTYWVWGCVQRCVLWPWPWPWRRKQQNDRNFHASNWLFAQTTHVDIAPWNFACGVVSGK